MSKRMKLAISKQAPTVLQILPALISGGVERGTVDMAAYIVQQGWNAIVVSSGGPMAHEVERAGGKHIALPVDSKNPLQILWNARVLAKIIRDRNVSIIHARSRAPAWSAFKAARKTGTPFVTSFHGAYNFTGKVKRWYNSIMTRGARVIAVSHFIESHIAANYDIDPDKIDVVPRGIDLLRFDPVRVHRDRVIKLAGEWNIPDDKPIIMLPGRISRWKGQRELLMALSKLPHKNFYCLFVGSDHGHESYRQEIERLVSELQLEGLVKWVGECKDMPAAYLLADVVVSASIEPEAFGRVVVEAQAMGRPVIATNHGGSAETIIDGETGLLYPADDINALSQMIGKVLTLNAQARERLAETQMAHARAHYSREQMCEGEFAVYKKVLSKARKKSNAA
ncbi:MAG: glycosyltransferase [Alphaproteobacteria bacterium]|nr:MAG: glycosyltransferase [Alphaproteobacteria bacterium]